VWWKRITIVLDDKEYEKLVKVKQNLTWKELIFRLVELREESKEKMREEILKEPYLRAAEALLSIGRLLGGEYEGSSLIPLYSIGGRKLEEREVKILLLTLANIMEKIAIENYPDKDEEIKWISQAIRMLAMGKEDLYELSLRNLCEEIKAPYSP